MLLAQEVEKGWDERINDAFKPVSDAVAGIVFYPIQFTQDPTSQMPVVIIILLIGATIFTFYFKFIQFRGFKPAIDTVRRK